MSYSVNLIAPTCPTCGCTGPQPYKTDPTYNLAEAFHIALSDLPWPSPDVTEFARVISGAHTEGPRGLDLLTGLKANETTERIRVGIQRLSTLEVRELLKPWEIRNNGWGTVDDAIEVLERLLEWSEKYPNNTWDIL